MKSLNIWILQTLFIVNYQMNFLHSFFTRVANGKSIFQKVSKCSLSSSSRSELFFDLIGNPKYVSAPMVDQSELAWRLLTRSNGVDLCFTQMILAKQLLIAKDYRRDVMDWLIYSPTNSTPLTSSSSSHPPSYLSNLSPSVFPDEEKQYLLKQKALELDKHLIVQLAGDDVESIIKAGKLVQSKAAAIDLNLGCPQNTAKRGNYGSHLLQDTELVLYILSHMVEKLDCPITAKIRIFDDDDKTIRLCQKMETLGISMITVHGRTVNANKLFVGSTDWDVIRKIKSAVKIPVMANGGISNFEDVNRCFESTGADAVMSSEALLENPKLFANNGQGHESFCNDYINTQLATVDEYMSYVLGFGILNIPRGDVVRSHLFKILYRFVDAPQNADLRKILAEGDLHDILYVISELKTRLARVENNTQKGIEQGYIGPTNWYMRHRDSRAMARRNSTPRHQKMTKDQLLEQSALTNMNRDNRIQLLRARYADKLKPSLSAAGTDYSNNSNNINGRSGSSNNINSSSSSSSNSINSSINSNNNDTYSSSNSNNNDSYSSSTSLNTSFSDSQPNIIEQCNNSDSNSSKLLTPRS